MKVRNIFITITSFMFFSYFLTIKAAEKPLIYKIDLKQEIGSTTWLYVQNGFKEAKTLNATAIILHMNTYGGAVLYADSIRTIILNSSIPVFVLIDNNAASAGALIAIACDSIYMRKGAAIGAATVVDQSGEKMTDKYQSYMRKIIRSTAEAHGKDTIIQKGDTIIKWRRDPRIAEAMVDERISIPGIIDSLSILTFSTNEAIQNGYCEGIAENVDEVITKYLHYPEYTLSEYHATAYDEVKGFLMNPVFQAILIMLIIGGIYFELQSPGIGFPSIVAVIAVILYFTPLYIDGLAQNWEIAVFIIGLILILLEIFVIPGFGITGIAGIICVFTGLILGLLNNVDFDFSGVSGKDAGIASMKVLSGLVLGFIIILYLSNKIGSKGMFKKLALETNQDVSEGYISVPMEPSKLIGHEGIAKTVLRPSGKVLIDNEIYDAVSNLGFIEKDEKVKVIKYESGQVYVEKII